MLLSSNLKRSAHTWVRTSGRTKIAPAMASSSRSFASATQEQEWKDQGVLDEHGLTKFSTLCKYSSFWNACRLWNDQEETKALKFVFLVIIYLWQTKCKSMRARYTPIMTCLEPSMIVLAPLST